MKPTILVLSCEHGGNDIPQAYQSLFADQQVLLNTHHGLDIGALEIAEHLQQTLQCGYEKNTISRLIIDCNRSLNHPQCFSKITKTLSSAQKQIIIDSYYQPYRRRLETRFEDCIQQGYQVLHLSIHSFPPESDALTHNAAIGLLYDSTRHGEKEVARIWHELLIKKTPTYRVRMNYPHQGTSDGFTSFLRKKHGEKNYLGIEVHINQIVVQDPETFPHVKHTLAFTLADLMQIL